MNASERNRLKTAKTKAMDELSLFGELFDSYARTLTIYAYRIVNDWQTAEDLVQDMFVALWEKRAEIDFNDPIKPYLYRAVYNRSLNYLNSALIHNRIEEPGTIDELINREILLHNQHDTLLQKEIAREIDRFIETLPTQCKTVYKLSREKNLRNKEIAAQLNISEKAVEKHISKALAEIRNHLIRIDILTLLYYLIGH